MSDWEVHVQSLRENRANLGAELIREEELRRREIAIRREEINKMIESLQSILSQDDVRQH